MVTYYAEQKLYRKAIKHGIESLKLNPDDNLGVRYPLMAIYVLIADYRSANSFYRSNELSRFDDQLTLCMLTATVLEGRIEDGKKLAKQLLEINSNITEFFADDCFDLYRVHYHLPLYRYYAVNSVESLALAFDQLLSLYELSLYLYETIQSFLKELDPVNFTHMERRLSNPYRAMELAGKGIFKNIQAQYFEALLNGEFETAEDFKSASKEDILALPMIGKATLRKLEENGVRFKDSES